MSFRWGIVPAAGLGTRIQPLAFSKELLPVGTRYEGLIEHPRAVSEYLLERMLQAGVNRVCFVISPAKTDIVSFFGGKIGEAPICYTVQQNPNGLCDALFSALPLVAPDDHLYVGLPDTVWFPADGFCFLPDEEFSFLLFPVSRPELFDSVVTDQNGRVEEIQVKRQNASSRWVWGAFKLTGRHFARLHQLWIERNRCDEYWGTLVNAYLLEGGRVYGIQRGNDYVDVGTLHGYREALRVLSSQTVCHEMAS
ncbi:MAG: nucleotidyltransferase family protein [Acidobacteriaceae bacterium]|nr:nucleotidyltransferase family protein [Acidobacteriota bacterium]MBV9442270.1 nucleotidyltransferase family protein [Acidobacteriaceae bacterium]